MNIKIENDFCTPTPPASSPECPPLSPAYRSSNDHHFSQTPDALGLYGYPKSRAENTPRQCPNTPTEAWPSEAQQIPSCSIPLEAPWTSTSFETSQPVSTSPMTWATPAAFGHFLPAFTNDIQTPMASFSSSSLHVTHGLPSREEPTVSRYPNVGYYPNVPLLELQSSFVAGDDPYHADQFLQRSLYSELYQTADPRMISPQHDSTAPARPASERSDHTHSAAFDEEENLPELRPLIPRLAPRRLSAPAVSQAGEESIMASVARVRRRRQRSITADSILWKCPTCDHKFDRSYNYKEHLKTHNPSRDRPFPCTEEGCPQRPFTRIHDLDRHMKAKHARVREHECGFCGRKFGRKDTLRRHMEDGCQRRRQIKGGTRSRTRNNNRNRDAEPVLEQMNTIMDFSVPPSSLPEEPV